MRRDSVRILKMRGTETEGTFGSLKAAMTVRLLVD